MQRFWIATSMVLMMAGLAGAEPALDAEAFAACLEAPVGLVEEEGSLFFFHECLGFYANAPEQELLVAPPQVIAEGLSKWAFQVSSGTASVIFMAFSGNEDSAEAMADYLDGTRSGFLKSGKKAGREVSATEPTVVWTEEEHSGSFEAMVADVPMVCRAVMQPGGQLDASWVVSMTVVGYDLESAYWMTESLGVLPPDMDDEAGN